MRIRRATRNDIPALATIIRKAFRPVARKFGLDKSNAPTHPSFIKPALISWEMDHGAEYFIGVNTAKQAIGCVSIKTDNDNGTAELRRLAVIPVYQKKGFGEELIERVEKECRKHGFKTITIGIISKHRELHNWYLKCGFRDTGTKRFPHLPFMVRYMCKHVPEGIIISPVKGHCIDESRE